MPQPQLASLWGGIIQFPERISFVMPTFGVGQGEESDEGPKREEPSISQIGNVRS